MRWVSWTYVAAAPAAGSRPQSGKDRHAMAALGYLAVSPPRATVTKASIAAAVAARAVRGEVGCVSALSLSPPSAPVRTAAAPSVAKSAIATTQCATVA